MTDLRKYLEQYAQDIQSILQQAKNSEELISLAEKKWFDQTNPKETDPRLLVFLSAVHRFPFSSGTTIGTDEGDKLNEVLQPQPPK